ncbi:MAG: MBL fold metallo-hydrolase [Terracidiphilus sp.]|jgi:hydroxyacylglutathione hydrolase
MLGYEEGPQYAEADLDPASPQVVVLKTCFLSMKNYSYLVVDPVSRQAVIVDPSWQIEKIRRALADARVVLKGVLLTHSHLDHTHLAEPLAEMYRCPIWMANEEIAASGFRAKQLVGIEATPWAVGNMLIEPILTPGHTPGCMCYRIGQNLFSGDVLFAEGCGLCADVPSAHNMFASLEDLKRRLDPQTRVYPGHSYGEPPGRTMARLLKENMYLQFRDQKSFAAYRLRSGQDRAKMFRFH